MGFSLRKQTNNHYHKGDLMLVFFIWFLIWFIERNMNMEANIADEMADELFLTGVYHAGDEFKI